MPTYDAVLLDLYDTLVWSDWLAWQHTLAERLGITPQAMGEAFTVTRPARSKGENADESADMAADRSRRPGIAPDPDLVAELIALEGEMMRDSRAPLRRFAGRRARPPCARREDRAREQLLVQHAARSSSDWGWRRSSMP